MEWDRPKTLEDFVAAAAVLKARPDCTGKIEVVGFCIGGTIANMPDNNDTTPRYDQAAATLARQRTVEFLNKSLRG